MRAAATAPARDLERPRRAPRRSRSFAVGLAALAVLAVAVRVAYVVLVGRRLAVMGDAETYHLLADGLAAGRGYVRPREYLATGARLPTAEFPPLFPGLLAVLDAAGVDSVAGQKLALGVVGAVTVVVVGLLGRRVGGDAVGLVAAGIAALHPAFFLPDGALAAETLYGLLVAAVLLAAYAAAYRPSSPWRWAVLGALVGAAALTRAEALGLLAVVVVPLALSRGGRAARERVASVGLAVAACLLVLAPWTVRNLVRFDRLVPVSNNSGTLLLGANCPPVYEGDQIGLWRLDCVFAAGAGGGDEAETFARYRSAGLRFAGDHAGRLPAVISVRVLRTWGLWDPAGQVAWESLEGRSRRWGGIGHRVHLVVLALAVGGAAVLARRGRLVWPLVSVAVLVTLTAAASYGSQRFRMAAEPALAVAAAAGVVALVGRARAALRR